MDFNWILPESILERLDPLPYKREYVELTQKLNKQKTQKLHKICDTVKCGPFGSTVLAETYSDNGVLYLRPVNISENKFLGTDVVFLSYRDIEEKKLDLFCSNDLFFARVGNPSISKVSSRYDKITISPNIVAVKVGNKIDSDYLWMFLSSKYGIYQVERMLKTVAQPTTSTETIKEIDVLISSVEIQKYIGDKVREAEELREEAKRLKKECEETLYRIIELQPLEEIKDLKFSFVKDKYIDSERLDSSYYSNKYTRLETILKNKNVIQLKDIIIDSKYGASVSANYVQKGIPFIRGTNLMENEIDDENVVYLDEGLNKEIGKCLVNTGDILITRSGTVGISAVVDDKCNNFAYGSFMIKICTKSNIWNAYYISAYLNSYWGKWQIERLQNGAVQQNINLQELGRIMIPKVSLEFQNKIEELVKRCINKKKKANQLIKEAKQDIEDLIEGNFDMSKVNETN